MQNSKPRIIVFFVPGIMASHITDRPDGSGVIGWPINNKAVLALQVIESSMDQRRGFTPGTRLMPPTTGDLPPASAAPDVHHQYQGWQTVATMGYGDFLADLEANSNLPFQPIVCALGYNFALSNHVSASTVAARTVKYMHVLGADGFLFVTHSMGALVTRAALKLMHDGNDPLLKNCLGVIHVCAPNAGSEEAFNRLYFGVHSPGNGVMDWASDKMFGDTGWKFTTVATAIQSFYELLPFTQKNMYVTSLSATNGSDLPNDSPYYLHEIANALFDDSQAPGLYSPIQQARWSDAKNNLGAIHNDIQTFSALALSFQSWLGTYYFAKTFVISSTGVNTTQQIAMKFRAGHLAEFTSSKSMEGDGSVPLYSQETGVQAANVVRVSGIEHSSVFYVDYKSTVYIKIYELMNVLFQNKDQSPLSEPTANAAVSPKA